MRQLDRSVRKRRFFVLKFIDKMQEKSIIYLIRTIYVTKNVFIDFQHEQPRCQKKDVRGGLCLYAFERLTEEGRCFSGKGKEVK